MSSSAKKTGLTPVWKKRLRYGFGYFMLVMGGIGLFLPIWPTTPFVLVAAWCFADNPRIQRRLEKITFFREYIESYRNGTGISKKTLAGSLAFLWGMLILSGCFVPMYVRIILLTVGLAVTTHLVYLYRKGKLRRTLFSLIELLFVIGIIAVLAGMLLPALHAARQRGYEGVCRANLKQIGFGLESYTDDHNGMIPDTGGMYNAYSVPIIRMGGIYALGHLVDRYGLKTEIFGCSANTLRTPKFVRDSWNGPGLVHTGYLYRETDVDFHPKKSAAANAGKAMAIDFACLYITGDIIPHGFENVNILYNDGHVENRKNSGRTNELYTMASTSPITPCEFVWEHADKR